MVSALWMRKLGEPIRSTSTQSSAPCQVAQCCSVLQCAAVCCSVLQRVAVERTLWSGTVPTTKTKNKNKNHRLGQRACGQVSTCVNKNRVHVSHDPIWQCPMPLSKKNHQKNSCAIGGVNVRVDKCRQKPCTGVVWPNMTNTIFKKRIKKESSAIGGVNVRVDRCRQV